MMDAITNVVSHNAGINKEQSIKAIEAVLAYVHNEMPEEISKAVHSQIVNSNANTGGGLTIVEILNKYAERHGSLLDRFK